MIRGRTNIGPLIQVAISVLVGAAVLAGFFASDLSIIVDLLGNWTAIIVSFALLLGMGNVLRVHLGRIMTMGKDWPYSTVLVGSALAVILVGLIGNRSAGDPAVQWIFSSLYQPIAASLAALLVFFVASAAFRALQAGPSAAWVMLGVAFLVILGSAAWSRADALSILADTREWLMSVPVMAGMRGILLGAALGATATGLRVILGLDRPTV